MSSSPPPEGFTGSQFVCDCKEQYRSACVKEEFYRECKGKSYCVLHFPGLQKSSAFAEALQRKTDKGGDFDFQGVWFPDEVDFTRRTFAESDFTGATFAAKAVFSRATFSEGAYFSGSTFKGEADFGGARFKEGVNFADSTFIKATNFKYAHFLKEVDFTGACFDDAVVFRDATFGDHVRFAGGKDPVFINSSSLDFQFARIEKADRISFHTLTMRPSWFVNVDPRNFRFTNVNWDWRTIKEELETVTSKNTSPHLTLATAYRNLAINAEENHRYQEASKFRYRAMDATRIQHWAGWDLRRLSWWYWGASGYGERVPLAAIVLLSVLVISAVIYTRVGFVRWEPKLSSENDATIARRDEDGAPLPLRRAVTYSAAVMTFQRPEPRPATMTAQIIVLLETILGPVQAALLALAIRRKFMR